VEQVIIILDFVLIAAALWAIFAVRGLGGLIGKAFTLMLGGMLLLGIAHISETLTFEVLGWAVDLVELTHRLIVLAGFVLLTLGFGKIRAVRQ
jgi:hypothetical protein